MPQDGSNNYQYPPGTPGIPDTTIESEAYNTFLDDLVLNDLNIPRPVHRGGTGASTADAALVNLKAEKAEQVVTAYLSQVWMPGSFRSAIGATDAPVAGHAFAGICYINEPLVSPPTNANVTVEARDQSDTVVPGKKYIRQKIAGVWSAWAYEDQDVIDYADAVRTYAAPFDALAYNGMQINGSMEVSQELGAGGRTTSGYVCDGWRVGMNGTMAYVAVADANGGGIFPLFPKYRLLVNITTAQTSFGAGDYTQVQQYIEGWRCARLNWGTANAQPVTIGFWTAHARTGIFSVVVRNGVDDRSYATTYTQAVASVAQYNVVTIPGPTAGSWTTDNTSGLKIAFSLGCGATYTAPSVGSWLSGLYIAAPGQVNAVAATSDNFRLTGVTVLPGTQAPTAAQSPMIMRPYDQELATCQRYWSCSNPALPKGALVGSLTGNTFGYSNVVFGSWKYAATMRANPSITVWNNGVANQIRDDQSGAVIAVVPSTWSVIALDRIASLNVNGAPLTVNRAYGFDIQLDARL